MSDLTEFKDQRSLLEAIGQEAMENGNLSIRGVARLANVNDRAILRGAEFCSMKLGQKLAAHSFQGAELTKNGFPAQAVILTLEYFAYESKVKSKQAQNLVRTFGMLGLMQTLEKLKQPKVVEIPQPVERTLPKHTVIEYIEAANKLESLKDSVLKCLLKDALVDEISLEQNIKYLPIAEKPKQYTIVKVRAKMLGYSDREIGDGKQLGKFVSSRIEPTFKEMVGRYEVNHFEINSQLDESIHLYFS